MPELKWDKTEERFYENGVSKGVLFVKGQSGYSKGVVWNGLTSVTMSPEGAEATDIYADNIKYLSLRSAVNVKGTIECLSTPEEFDVCDGTAQLSSTVKGVRLVGQQKRSQFAFCYRTEKGNADNPEYGYQLHIVYGCSVSPTERAYETVNDSPEAATLSYEFDTVPVEVGHNMKPTAHIIIDSSCSKIAEIEAALYGTDPATEGAEGTDSELLLPEDLWRILNTTNKVAVAKSTSTASK